ncbi:MAG: hypothetical protein ABUL77_00450 [Bacteroidota bacterium]
MFRRGGVLLLRALAAGLLGAGAGCSTVELKEPPANVNACRPSQIFFVERVWPEFLSQSYGGKKCSDSGCHRAGGGRFLSLPNVDPPPMPAFPLEAGSAWEMAYVSAAQQMTCTNVQGSDLYTLPAGLRTPHGGGKLLDDPAAVEALLTMWVAASP